MKIKDEKGVAMVEATIYMPIVLCVVMSLIYLALFNMQEYMMLYEAQRVAAVAAREDAYIGYDAFEMGENNEIEFGSSADVTSEAKVEAYMKAHNRSIGALYRGASKLKSIVTGGQASQHADDLAGTVVEASSLVAITAMATPEIEVKTGFLGTNVTVTIKHKMPMPGVMAYLGYDGSTTLKASAYTFSINTSEFVRNVDLAPDITKALFERLGLNYDSFVSKTDQVLGKVKKIL